MSTSNASVQARIGRSLLQARAGEDQALAALVRDQGDVLVNVLAGLMKLVRVHDAANRAFETPVRELGRVLDGLVEALGPVGLVAVEDQVYVNDVRIRLDHKAEVATFLTSCLAGNGIGGLTFHGSLDETAIRTLITELGTDRRGNPSDRAGLQQRLDVAGVVGVELVAPLRWREANEGGTLSVATGFPGVYRLALRRVAQAWMAMAAGRTPHPAPLRRAVLDMVDFCSGSQQEIMLVLADHALESHLAHAVHVTAIALILGVELGLDEGALSDLGVAAVFHDTGTLTLPDRPAADRERHPIAGVRTLLRQQGFHPGKIRRLLATAQHHDAHTLKGRFNEPRSLFARIIHIADDYDTFTRVRGIRPLLTPPAALEYMSGAAGTEYDPLLFQILVNKLGRFPPGTLVALDDGRWGLVISGVRLPRWFSRPLVRVIRLADGSRAPAGLTVDLARGGTVRRVIQPD